jgi:hypothetical protein
MSKKKTEGYQRKSAWLDARFTEGLQIKMLTLPERGFIEYISVEFAWRGVIADGYMIIPCLWIVGKSKGKGLSTAFLDACIADSENQKLKGVAMVTNEKDLIPLLKQIDKGDADLKAR